MITGKTLITTHGRPPNFEQIVKVFPFARTVGTIFTYGDTAYLSGKKELTPELREHEAVHATRQLAYPGGAVAWWDRYLIDAQFRLDEELHAHRAEYRAHRKRHGQHPAFLRMLVDRLSGPLYGNILSDEQAKNLILVPAEVSHE